MSEEQANLLAGQFGGLRITAIQQLNMMGRQLDTLNAIQVNTFELRQIEKTSPTFKHAELKYYNHGSTIRASLY
jgi:hypothetical protein